MKKISFLLLFLFLSITFFPQTTIKGTIKDSETGDTLAFANVIISKTEGTVTDAEGNFRIEINHKVTQFEISYIGYENKTIVVKPSKSYYAISLKPEAESLETVVISGKYVNPAIALMQKVIKQKSDNDYRKKLNKYSFIKYYKFLVTANRDSINAALDSIFHNGNFARIDSAMYNSKKYLKDKDMFVMESVMKVNGVFGVEKNKVIASRTAGFKNPMYEMLALQVSNQNVYDDNYKFLIKEYLGPLTKKSLKQYKYEIDDSIKIQGRLVYVLSYKKTKKPLISGKLYIDKQSLAIAKITLNTFEQFELQTVHDFNYYPKQDSWFPSDAQLHIKKARRRDAIYLDGLIEISNRKEHDSITHSNKDNMVDLLYATSKTQYTEVNLGGLHQDKIVYNLQVAPDARNKSGEFWEKYKDTLTLKRDLNTYKFTDSIAEKGGMESKLTKLRKLSKGKYAIGTVDFNITNLIDKNQYEGLRLSLRGVTNEKLSNKFSIGGYVAYGFKDKEFKYQALLNYKLAHISQTYLHASYTKDLQASGSFTKTKDDFLQGALGYVSYDKFYESTAYELGISHLLFNTLKATTNIKKQEVSVKHPVVSLGGIEFPNTAVTSMNLGIEYQPFSTFFLGAHERQILKSGYPKFYFNLEKTIPIWGNQQDFYRMNFQTDYKKTYLNKHYTEVVVRLGFASKGTNLTHLFSPFSKGYDDRDTDWYKRIHLKIDTGFETMKNLEFADNLVATIGLQHTFSKIKLTDKYNFDIRLIGRAAWGTSYTANRYVGIKTLEKGYFESGIELNRLVKFYGFGVGVGSYYRMGAHAYENPYENLTFRITVTPPSIF